MVHINELEGCGVLAALIAEMGAQGILKGYLVPGSDSSTGMQLALIDDRAKCGDSYQN